MKEFAYLAKCLGGFFFGLYSGIFAMYLQNRYGSKKDPNKGNSIVFYALCLLYVLSVVMTILNLAIVVIQAHPIVTPNHLRIVTYLDEIQPTVFACCDFIAQFILIYRCWIVWGCNTRVVIVPVILAFAFLALWIAAGSASHFSHHEITAPAWTKPLTITALAMSMVVNGLATSLIVFRISKVFQEVKANSDEQTLGATGRSTFRPIIFVLIESGMILFSIQLARFVLANLVFLTPGAALKAYGLVASVHEMLNGITPTIILVRVSMGFSFHDEKSMTKASTESLHFASANETESIYVDEETRNDDLGIQLRDGSDIQV